MSRRSAERLLGAIWLPASVALIVGVCTLTMVQRHHENAAIQQNEARADVVEAAIKSIDGEADRAFFAVEGALAATADAPPLRSAIAAVVEPPSLASTITIVDAAGTVVATNQDSPTVARSIASAGVDGASRSRPRLVLAQTEDRRDRLVFAAPSRTRAVTIFIELTLDRSAYEDLPPGTAFVVNPLDQGVGNTIARTDVPLGQRSLRRSLTIGDRPAELTVSGPDASAPRGAWAAALLAALCAAAVTATARSAYRWRAERRQLHRDDYLLDGALTHQLHVEADLRSSETQLRAVLDSTPDAVAILDPSQQRFRLLNRTQLLGHDAANFEGNGFVFAIAGGDVGGLRTWWSSLSSGQRNTHDSIEFSAISADGRPCRLHLRVAPLRGAGLTLQHRCVGVFTDITTQHEQREREDEMRGELERVRHLESLGRLSGGIAHDFRNVLAAVDINTELLAARVQPEQQRYIDVIQRASTRAAEMVHQLLSFAQRDRGQPVTVDLNHAVLEIEAVLRSSVGSTVSIEFDLDERPCVTLAGLGDLDRLILNLVCNARDAMPSGGKIRISTGHASGAFPPSSPESEWVLLAVADNGDGIPDDIIAKVFDPFFTTKGGAGSGLGLASVHGIVSALGGHVDLTSALGRGTTVTIALRPAVAGPTTEYQGPSGPQSGEHGPSGPQSGEQGPSGPQSGEHGPSGPRSTEHGRRAVLVDDDAEVRESFARLLRDRGFDVVEAASAHDGLAAMAQSPPDVLVTDIVMPGGMNGLELAHIARQEFPGVAVLLVSGYANAVVDDGTSLPYRLVHKPFSSEEVLAALDSICGVETA